MHRLITTLLNEKNERKSDKDTKLDVLNILANVAALPNAGGEVRSSRDAPVHLYFFTPVLLYTCTSLHLYFFTCVHMCTHVQANVYVHRVVSCHLPLTLDQSPILWTTWETPGAAGATGRE